MFKFKSWNELKGMVPGDQGFGSDSTGKKVLALPRSLDLWPKEVKDMRDRAKSINHVISLYKHRS